MLEFDNVSFFYGNAAVFKNFSCNLNENEVAGVQDHSRSGCGKTTFLELSCGI